MGDPLKIGRSDNPKSNICSSNQETIIIRGEDLVENLLGEITFTEHIWFLITGARPTLQQRRILDATLVSIAEHGLVPSVVAARMTLAAAPEALQGAVAAGLLGCGSVILGSAQAAGEFLHAIVTASQGQDDRLVAATEQQVNAFRASKRSIPGFGHPLHKAGDPRAIKLLRIAKGQDIAGPYAKALAILEESLPRLVGRELKMNISAAIPAVLLDSGFPLGALKGIPLLARAASLVAHLLEEQLRPIGFIMADSAARSISYDGSAPIGFVPSED
jgi:citrate synthase